jgi:hypothetical protein
MLLQGASTSWSPSRDGSLKFTQNQDHTGISESCNQSRGQSGIGGVTYQRKTGKIEFQVRAHHHKK